MNKLLIEDWKLAREALTDYQEAIDILTGGNSAVSLLVCEIIRAAADEAEARRKMGAESFEAAFLQYMKATKGAEEYGKETHA